MMIELNNVSWQREDRWIIKDVSWKVQEQEHWCLVGLNGSGKTTLLNIINGYIWPTKGEVTVLGEKFGEVDLRDLRKKIGWVSSSLQEKLYGHERALDIVLTGIYASIGLYDKPSEEDVQKAMALLAKFDCAAFADRTYATLSQGEKQKVLIARAMMASPRLLILDEPCNGLDMLAREQLLGMIQQIAELPDAPTLLYVTHHVEEILPCFAHALLLKDGRAFHAGPVKEAFTSEKVSAFLDVPVEVQQWNNRTWITMNRVYV